MLKAGAVPSEIYASVLASVDSQYNDCFMGAKGRTMPFLGHGVGLQIDEYPVLAKGFDQPIVPNMTIAVEPKIGIDGRGLVGSENTYLITELGAESLTGQPLEIIEV